MKIVDIAFLGTSLTIGAGIAHSYTRDLIPALEKGKDVSVRTYNFSVDGARSDTGILQYPKILPLRPKFAIIEYQMNDCNNVVYGTSESRHIAMINGIKAASPGTRIFLMTMNPALGSGAVGRENLPSYYQMYRDLAASQNVGLVDTFPSWSTATLDDIPGGVHPLPAAHRRWTVPGIVAALSPLI